MKNKAETKTHDFLFWIFFALLTLSSLTLLELNKNTLAAWGGTLALLAGYALLRQKKLRGRQFSVFRGRELRSAPYTARKPPLR